MTRYFQNLREAALEIRRDLAKAPQMTSTRVQHTTHLDLPGRELVHYSYAIRDVPSSTDEVVELGIELKLPLWVEHAKALTDWLEAESMARIHASEYSGEAPAEMCHPALATCAEGSHFAYTYSERLSGAMGHWTRTLNQSPDSRRSYWPVFQPLDSLRSAHPTRVPCTLGYSPMLRSIGPEQAPALSWHIFQRSCDFDTFWLSDVFFGAELQRYLAASLTSAVQVGILYHTIMSFHRFDAGAHIY